MTKKLLTVRKEKWVNHFKPDVLRGQKLTVNAAIQARYATSIEKLIRQMASETEREVKKLFKGKTGSEFFAEDESISAQARILTNALAKKFETLFDLSSKPLAEDMISDTDKMSQLGIQSSLRDISGGLTLKTDFITGSLKEAFSASISENVSLIKTIAPNYFGKINAAVMRSITTGNGLQDLVPFFAKQKDITIRHARIMALDQTRKAYSHLNKERAVAMGVKKFEWIHSGGGHNPRELHKRMSGNIYSFDDPPIIDEKTGERGIPGDAINCKCSFKIIVDFSGN